MKEFFKNLFGKQPAPPDVEQRAEPAAAKPSPQPAFEPYKKGDVIGGTFEVLRKLGEGGFGVVYLVRHRQSGDSFALKTFRDELLADPASREAFKKEALLWSNLQSHPCIVAARWVQEFHGRLFVMMDYLPADSAGRVTLGDHLADGSIDPNVALQWAIEFCHGMEHAIRQGIRCHRDIKPANILITQDGTLKIADFGLAALAERRKELTAQQRMMVDLGKDMGVEVFFSSPKRATVQNREFIAQGQDGAFGFSITQTEGKMICGTPGYIAPEVYRSEGADERTDIYSFGLVLWQMAAGSRQPPFLAPWRGDMQNFLRATYEQQIAGRLPAVNCPFSAVIGRCLNPEPSGRYPSFAELRNALEVILESRTKKRVQIPQPEAHQVSYFINQGGSLCALGKYVEALVYYDKALEMEPQCALAWSNKGVALYFLGRNQESLRCLEKALDIDASDEAAWSNVGNVLSTLGRHEDAIRCCDKALALEPGNPTTWNNKGNAHHALGRYDEAIACYNQAVAVDPRDARGWYNRGGSLRALRRYSEAVQSYAKALAINPHSASACYSKAESEYALKQWRDAAASYRKFIELKSSELANLIPTARQRLQELESKGF